VLDDAQLVEDGFEQVDYLLVFGFSLDAHENIVLQEFEFVVSKSEPPLWGGDSDGCGVAPNEGVESTLGAGYCFAASTTPHL
jgi:hypothetical protein